MLADPDQSRALICWNINPVASNPEQAALRAALAREDLLTVVCDLFLTDTAAYADYVLPAAGFLECDDILPSYFHHTLSAQVKAVDPPGHALRNSEIFRRLAADMGFDEQALQEGDAALIEHLLAPSGVSWDELARAGTVRLYPEPRAPVRRWLPNAERSDRDRVGDAEADGHPRLPGAVRRRAAAPPGQLRLLAGVAVADELDVRERRKLRHRIGEATVTLTPCEAAARGLRTGDGVTLAMRPGALQMAVEISDAVPPGVAYAPKCRWPSHESAGANVNLLNPGDKTDMGRARQSTASSSSSPPGSIGECVPPAATFLESLDLPRGRPARSARVAEALRRRRPLPRREIPSCEGRAASRRCSRRPRASTCACTRASQGSGVFMLTDAELAEMAAMGAQRSVEVSLFARPNAAWDTSAWRAGRRGGCPPRPRAGRSRSCRASPTRAARQRPPCAAC